MIFHYLKEDAIRNLCDNSIKGMWTFDKKEVNCKECKEKLNGTKTK